MSNRSDRRGRVSSRASSTFSFEIEEEEEESQRRSDSGRRGVRLERAIERELRAMVSDDVRDPLARRARVLRVELSVDYRNARVFWTHERGERERAQSYVRAVEAALDRCAGFMRATLAEALAMDRVPLLRFVYEADPPEAWLRDESDGDACE
jgi:ribosome-binding factor A